MGIINALCNSPLPNQFTTSMSVRERKMLESALTLVPITTQAQPWLKGISRWTIPCTVCSRSNTAMTVRGFHSSCRTCRSGTSRTCPLSSNIRNSTPQTLPPMSGFQIPTYLQPSALMSSCTQGVGPSVFPTTSQPQDLMPRKWP